MNGHEEDVRAEFKAHVLYGPVGVGKSHIALNRRLEGGIPPKVPGACSVLVVKIVGHKVVGFDRVELRHVVTAERRREDCGEDN